MEQKCLIASAGMHGLLILLLVVGSAFFVQTEKANLKPRVPTLTVVPAILVDGLLAGGGGNPNVKPIEGKQKGETLIKQPIPPAPEAKPQEKPIKPADVKPEHTAKPKDKPDKTPLTEVVRPNPNKTSPNAVPDFLKPVDRKEAERAAAEEAARQWQVAANAGKQAISRLKQGLQSVREGFADGTVVQPYGPGGLAYAPYAAFVKAVYDDAWRVNDLIDESSTCVARVTIASNGDVLSARIITPSGNTALDRSVQRALNSVRTIGRPFPEGATEKERVFTINFNLKSKRGLG
jgi:TonB family protein